MALAPAAGSRPRPENDTKTTTSSSSSSFAAVVRFEARARAAAAAAATVSLPAAAAPAAKAEETRRCCLCVRVLQTWSTAARAEPSTALRRPPRAPPTVFARTTTDWRRTSTKGEYVMAAVVATAPQEEATWRGQTKRRRARARNESRSECQQNEGGARDRGHDQKRKCKTNHRT